MNSINSQQKVEVQVYSFKDFFTSKAIYPVGIDSYQR